MKRYYIAYGSNLNLAQMKARCPSATAVGTAMLEGWELLFKGSRTGAYLTIEKRAGRTVPVAVWEVTEQDEKALDRYEGFPTFYYKKEIKLKYKSFRTGRYRTVNAFVYVMHENRPIGIPSGFYVQTCAAGYDAFSFDKDILMAAYDRCKEVASHEEQF